MNSNMHDCVDTRLMERIAIVGGRDACLYGSVSCILVPLDDGVATGCRKRMVLRYGGDNRHDGVQPCPYIASHASILLG